AAGNLGDVVGRLGGVGERGADAGVHRRRVEAQALGLPRHGDVVVGDARGVAGRRGPQRHVLVAHRPTRPKIRVSSFIERITASASAGGCPTFSRVTQTVRMPTRLAGTMSLSSESPTITTCAGRRSSRRQTPS